MPLFDVFFHISLSCANLSSVPGGISYTVRNDVRVAVEGSLWVSVCGVIAGQVPDDQGLVAGGGQEHVWAKPACQHHPPSA